MDVLGNPVTSVRCSADGNALLTSTLDSRIRLLDRDDGKLLKSFGQEDTAQNTAQNAPLTLGKATGYRNVELRIRSVFAKADAIVLSGSESNKDDRFAQAHIFAWDVLSGDLIASIPAGEKVKAVSDVAWNEKAKCWAGGCSDGMCTLPFLAFLAYPSLALTAVLQEPSKSIGKHPH